MKNLVVVLLCLFSNVAFAGQVYEHFPKKIHPDQKYVFYSHGLIVEGDNPKPVHPKYGSYEFAAIKQALASNSDFNLIAHHRPKHTQVSAYVTQLTAWVEKLIAAGVKPNSIVLLGFSRGGEITAYASSKLSKHKINTVLLATCWKGSVQDNPDITFTGHFLSIYETSDGAKSCQKLADRSQALDSFTELAISTGKEHGAFFTPLKQWVEPLKNWIDAKTL